MSSLQIIDKRPKLPLEGAGSEKWCFEVAEIALERAFETLENTKFSSGDLVHLMKIRRDMQEIIRQDVKVTWMDPVGWQNDEPKVA